MPHPDALPTPPPSYRTPMRYPWWGPGGDPFGYRPARRWRVPFAPPPHHGYRFSPVRRGLLSSCRTPMRYPPLPRLTAPRCGIHGGARAAGRTFGYRPARSGCVPPAVTPPWIPASAGKTRRRATWIPARTTTPSYRTPMRYPWWGPGGDPFGYRPARGRRGPPAVTPPWIPAFAGKTRAVVVVPHPDAVSMVGPGRRPLRLQTRSTLARTLRTATPPWIPAPHRSAG